MKHWGEKGIGGGFNKYSERKFLNSNSKAFFLLEVFKIKLTFEEMIKDLGSHSSFISNGSSAIIINWFIRSFEVPWCFEVRISSAIMRVSMF